ncbi:MAG: insulinase family protein [Firmicutes bacterium]|nr:insulinase family protein [Bacillota bacterium]
MAQIKTPTGEVVYQEQLPNGLTVFVFVKPDFLKKYAVLSTNYGSIDFKFRIPEEGIVEVPLGVAHFLEHKLFEEETGNIFTRFARWGASVNAFTSPTQTNYLFSTIDHWQESLADLISFVGHPFFTEENVEKEKGIIEQELRMYEDHPEHRLHSNLLSNLYHENPIRLDIGGTVESIFEITVEDLLKCHRTFYQPGNMALAMVGDLDPEQLLSIVRQNYSQWDLNNVSEIERFYPAEPREVVNAWVEERLSIARPHYLLGFKHEPKWRGEELLKQQITMSLVWRLIVGRSSQIFTDLYQADLVNDSFGASFNSGPQFAYSVIGSETDNPERLDQELRRIIQRLKEESVSSLDIERLKRQIYGGHLASYDSFEYAANRYISHYFDQTPYHRFIPILQSIEVKDVEQAIRDLLDFQYATVSVLRPVEKNG